MNKSEVQLGKTPLGILISLGLIIGCGCQERQRDPIKFFSDFDLSDSEIPLLVLRRDIHSSTQKGGVIAAVWRDGTLIRSKARDTVSKKMNKGRLRNGQMIVLLSRVRTALDSMPDTGIPMHSAYEALYVRMNTGSRGIVSEFLDWDEHPVEMIKRLIFSMEIDNISEIDAESYYDSMPEQWQIAFFPD